MIQKIKDLITGKCNTLFGVGIINQRTKHAVRFAKEYFEGKPINVLEIGVLKGYNARNFLKHLNINKIYLVDPFGGSEEKNYYSKDYDMSLCESQTRKLLKKYSDKTFFIKKYSDDAVDDIPEELDLIYIDGNHEYEYVKRDIENYYPKLKKGGILAGDNITTPGCDSDVFRAVSEFSYENKLYPRITRTDFWFIKK